MRVSFVLVKKVFPLFSCSGPARLIHHYLSFFITLDGEKLSADFDIINEVQFKVINNSTYGERIISSYFDVLFL